jgi:hypothetical protein
MSKIKEKKKAENGEDFKAVSFKLPIEVYNKFIEGYLNTNYKRTVDYFVEIVTKTSEGE